MSEHAGLIAQLWPEGETLTGPQVHMLVDGAQDPDIARITRLGTLEWTCLFGDRIAPALQAAAPYLVHLSPNARLTRTLLDGALRKHWGFLMVSPADISATQLRRHFKRYLKVQDEAGKELAFRFYDPRVLRIYFPSCTPEERRRFLGPLTTLYLADAAGRQFHPLSATRASVPQPESLPDLAPPVGAPHLTTLLRALSDAQWAPAQLWFALPRLRKHLPQAGYAEQRDWTAALRRVCVRLHDDGEGDIAFECGLLAASMCRLQAAIGFFELSIQRHGPHYAACFNLGLQLRLGGHYDAAEQQFQRAAASAPDPKRFKHAAEQTAAHRLRCVERLGAPFCAGSDGAALLSATLLGRHHAAIWHRRLDRDTARLAGLPQGLDLPGTRRWIREQAARYNADTLALLHPEWGLIGGFGLVRRHNTAFFYYWVATPFRSQGIGTVALRLLAAHALQAAIYRLYIAVDPDNVSSARALERAGFLPVDGAAPYWMRNLEAIPTDVGPSCYPDEVQLLLRDTRS